MLSRAIHQAGTLLLILTIGLIELFFLVFHFFCGTLSIVFGLVGCSLESMLHKALPNIYD